MRLLASASLLAIALNVCLGCAPQGPPPAWTEPLHVDNGTTLTLTVLVNRQVIRTVEPASITEIAPEELSPIPWNVEVRSSGGRLLLDLTVRPEDVTRTTGGGGVVSMTGDAARADLSCGRLDVWVGTPMLGPAPGPGTPGDCDP